MTDVLNIKDGMGHDGIRYQLGEVGDRLWIRFLKQPSGWLRAYLNRLGYKHYMRRGDEFIGSADQDGVRERIRSWAQTPPKHEKRDSSTLCWDCAKAYGGCSWSAKFEPVEGWDAEATAREHHRLGILQDWTSYHVKACPEFEVEERMRRPIVYERYSEKQKVKGASYG